MKRPLAILIGIGLLLMTGSIVHKNVYEVPVLMYHIVDTPPAKASSVYVHPDSFERQMEFLKLHRYRVVSLGSLIDDLKNGKPIGPKTVAITFDDGTVDNFRNAFPVLRKMGFTATIFMITDNIGKPGWLSEEDLKILDEAGITIGSHTAHHTFLPKEAEDKVRSELVESKKRLEEVLGHEVALFSYPAGGVTPEIARAVEEAGYAGAVTTNYGRLRHDPYAVHRVKIGDSARNLFNFWLKVSGLYRAGKKTVSYPGA